MPARTARSSPGAGHEAERALAQRDGGVELGVEGQVTGVEALERGAGRGVALGRGRRSGG